MTTLSEAIRGFVRRALPREHPITRQSVVGVMSDGRHVLSNGEVATVTGRAEYQPGDIVDVIRHEHGEPLILGHKWQKGDAPTVFPQQVAEVEEVWSLDGAHADGGQEFFLRSAKGVFHLALREALDAAGLLEQMTTRGGGSPFFIQHLREIRFGQLDNDLSVWCQYDDPPPVIYHFQIARKVRTGATRPAGSVEINGVTYPSLRCTLVTTYDFADIVIPTNIHLSFTATVDYEEQLYSGTDEHGNPIVTLLRSGTQSKSADDYIAIQAASFGTGGNYKLQAVSPWIGPDGALYIFFTCTPAATWQFVMRRAIRPMTADLQDTKLLFVRCHQDGDHVVGSLVATTSETENLSAMHERDRLTYSFVEDSIPSMDVLFSPHIRGRSRVFFQSLFEPRYDATQGFQSEYGTIYVWPVSSAYSNWAGAAHDWLHTFPTGDSWTYPYSYLTSPGWEYMSPVACRVVDAAAGQYDLLLYYRDQRLEEYSPGAGQYVTREGLALWRINGSGEQLIKLSEQHSVQPSLPSARLNHEFLLTADAYPHLHTRIFDLNGMLIRDITNSADPWMFQQSSFGLLAPNRLYRLSFPHVSEEEPEGWYDVDTGQAMQMRKPLVPVTMMPTDAQRWDIHAVGRLSDAPQ